MTCTVCEPSFSPQHLTLEGPRKAVQSPLKYASLLVRSPYRSCLNFHRDISLKFPDSFKTCKTQTPDLPDLRCCPGCHKMTQFDIPLDGASAAYFFLLISCKADLLRRCWRLAGGRARGTGVFVGRHSSRVTSSFLFTFSHESGSTVQC